MKRLLCFTSLLVVLFAASGQSQNLGRRWLSRYWDGCKATCSWTNNVPPGATLAKTCAADGRTVHPDPNSVRCAKDGGTGYTCWDQIPFVSSTDPNLAYGFGATGGTQCGTCFEVTFDGGFEHGTPYATHRALQGKRVIIMARNTGSDVAADQIDFMIPGGGLGLFDCFSTPVGQPRSAFGAQYGGLLADCERELNWASGTLQQYQTCLRNKCNALFNNTTQATLRQGCNFYADFMMAANNPTGTVRVVQCPAELTARYGGTTWNPPDGGGGGGPLPVTTYTLNVSRTPENAGNVRVGTTNNPPQQTHNAGTSLTITAVPNTGFSFVSWTATGGTTFPAGFNANNASNTITLNANLSIRANFQSNVTTHTVQVSRSPTAGGSVRINNGANNPTGSQSFTAGTSVTISATPASGYEFVNWTAASGTTLPTGFSAASMSNTFTINSNVNVQANFRLSTTQPPQVTTFTVQASRNIAIGGNVTINGNPPPAQGVLTLDEGARVAFVATPNSGYRFVNWTAVTGSLPTDFNANNASNTITLSSNVNVRANFEQNTLPPPPPTCQAPAPNCLRLGIRIVPEGAGSVITSPNTATFEQGQIITVTAVPANGFEFANWMGDDLQGRTDFAQEVNMWWERDIEAHFREAAGGGIIVGPPGGGGDPDGYVIPATRTDTLKVEAEDFDESNSQRTESSMRITTNNDLDNGRGITSIGWIENGNVAVYDVGISRTGDYSLVFRVGSNLDGGNSRFRVLVNDVNVGQITVHTGSWDEYTYVVLPTDIELLAGSNTIRLEFQNAVNVDYFLLLTEPEGGVSVRRPQQARSVARTTVTITNIPRGFTAALPHDHAFTQYSVVDLRGRVLRTGVIGDTQRNIRVNNMRSGVFFLRLEGVEGVTPQTIRAVTY